MFFQASFMIFGFLSVAGRGVEGVCGFAQPAGEGGVAGMG